MAQVYVEYNPYRMDTKIFVNGNEISDDNLLQYVKEKRLQEWVGGFPEQLTQALNSASFDVEFHGAELIMMTLRKHSSMRKIGRASCRERV